MVQIDVDFFLQFTKFVKPICLQNPTIWFLENYLDVETISLGFGKDESNIF